MNTLTSRPLNYYSPRAITRADIPLLAAWTQTVPTRSCDYTLGGIILWADYLDYRLTLDPSTGAPLISGRHPNDPTRRVNGLPIPADLPGFAGATPLGDQWSDYLYDIYSFASLAGNQMKKKRNHVNRFRADNPSATLRPLSASNARLCLRLLARLGNDGSPSGRAEQLAVARMLLHWTDYAPYLTGAVLTLNPDDEEIIAFTIGELKGDTLHVHVEKADHSIPGAGEAIASLFAAAMLQQNPSLQILNRQDDAGSPALRAAKLSWRPLSLLPKSL